MEDSENASNESRMWLKRAGWLFLAFLLFFVTPYALSLLGQLTGLEDWSETFGPLVWWNQANALPFMLGFAMILVLMAAIMYFVLQAFNPTEGAW